MFIMVYPEQETLSYVAYHLLYLKYETCYDTGVAAQVQVLPTEKPTTHHEAELLTRVRQLKMKSDDSSIGYESMASDSDQLSKVSFESVDSFSKSG